MATERLVIQVDEKGALVVKRNIESVGQSAKATGGALQLLKRALTALAGAAIIRGLVGIADEFTNIQNRLRLVTDGQEELSRVTDELFQISKRTRAEFSATAELYQKVALSAGELGINQQELLQFTESLNQAIILSGSDAQTAAGGIRQLAQGIAAGALRGDELISVLENLPAVAQIIAKQLGITVGQLRILGSQGKITSDIILEAFREQREEIAEKYGKTIITIGQAFTLLRNSVTRFVGELSASSGVASNFAKVIAGAASAIDLLRGYTDTLVVAVTSLAVTIGVVKFAAWAQAATGATTAIGVLTGGVSALRTATVALAASFGPLAIALTAAGAAATAATLYFDKLKKIQMEIEAIEERIYKQKLERLQAQVKEIRERKAAEEGLKAYVDQLKEELRIVQLSKREKEIEASLAKATEIAKRSLTDAEKARIETLYDERDALARQRAILDEIRGPQNEYRKNLEALEAIKPQLSVDEYNNKLKELQETYAGLNLPDLPAPPGFELPEAPDPVADVKRSLEQERELLGLSGDARERRAQIIQLENQLLSQQKTLQPDDRKAVEALIKENQSLARREELLRILRNAEAEWGIQLAATSELLELGTVSAEQYNAILAKGEAEIDAFAKKQQLFVDIFNSVWDNGLNAIRDFVNGGKVRFDEFASSVLASISSIIAELLRFQALKALGSAFGIPIPGGRTGLDFMVTGTGAAPDSQLVAFAASPGERVTVQTPSQQRAGAMAAMPPSQAAPSFKIVNVMDPNEIREAMAAEEGTQVILNTLTRNRSAARQVLS